MSDFAYYVFGQEPVVAMHLALWYGVLVCHQYDVCENYVSSVYVGGYGGLSEGRLCAFCRGLCACTEMLWMCVLYVRFGSKVSPRTFGCVAMGSALLFMVRFRLLVYSAGSGVNRVQVVLSGFSKRLFCFVHAKPLCRYGCMYFLAALVLVCVYVIVMSSA